MKRKPEPGDWIRFRRGGVLVLGIVEYVAASSYAHYDWMIHTDVGSLPDTAILETRAATR